MIEIYTDGAVRPHNPGPGGFGVFIMSGGHYYTEFSGYLGESVTNNRCEYLAVLAGLDYLLISDEAEITKGDEKSRLVKIYTDSLLVVSQVTGKWKMSSPGLRPLWREVLTLLKVAADRGWQIQLEHVEGHKGNPGNERADYLAGEAVMSGVFTEGRVRYEGLLNESESAETAVRGHEILGDSVKYTLESMGCLVTPFPTIEDKAMRDALARSSSPRAKWMLRTPNFIALTKVGPILIAVQTSFVVQEQGKRVLTADMWTALNSYFAAGQTVFIVHKPFGTGAWRTYRDLGWSESEEEVETVIADLRSIHVRQVDSPVGWGPTLELQTTWEPFEESVRRSLAMV